VPEHRGEVIVVVEEASERVPSSKEVLEDIVCALEVEGVATSRPTEARPASAATLGQSLFSVFVVYSSLVRLRKTFVGLTDSLEFLFRLFFVVWVLVL